MGRIEDNNQSTIERLSKAALDQFDRFGAALDSNAGEAAGAFAEKTAPTVLGRGTQEYLYAKDVERVQQYTNRAGQEVSWSKYVSSGLGKALSIAGGALDSATGVMRMAKEFHKDREAGEQNYPRAMRSMLSSVAQTSIGAVAGFAAGAAVGAIAAPALVPVAIGGAVAWGVSSLVGRFTNAD